MSFPSVSVLFSRLPAVSYELITVFILTCVILSKNIAALKAIMQEQTTTVYWESNLPYKKVCGFLLLILTLIKTSGVSLNTIIYFVFKLQEEAT